jgi:hypothetical protein
MTSSSGAPVRTYGFRTVVYLPYDETLERTRAALKEQGTRHAELRSRGARASHPCGGGDFGPAISRIADSAVQYGPAEPAVVVAGLAAPHWPRGAATVQATHCRTSGNPRNQNPQLRRETRGVGTVRRVEQSAGHCRQHERDGWGCGVVGLEGDLNSVRPPHARVHDKRVSQHRCLAWVDCRRTDDRVGWSTSLQHPDVRAAQEPHGPDIGVGEFELTFGDDVERHASKVDTCLPGNQATTGSTFSWRDDWTGRGGARARADHQR